VSHEIYLFGSITRGEVTPSSDTDILVIPLEGQSKQAYPSSWSYYTRNILNKMHKDGRLFSWHLYLDAKCIYTPKSTPLLFEMGKPSSYKTAKEDIEDLNYLLNQSMKHLQNNTLNPIYEIGVIHTCLRDIAMSASWWLFERPCFSIYAPYQIGIPLPLNKETYRKLISARHNSTRGITSNFDWKLVVEELLTSSICNWVLEVKRVCA
jgi:hypothetical protein